MTSTKIKRLMDDWIEKGICVRHKYINSVFKFIWRNLKKFGLGVLLSIVFLIGLVFYKSLWNKENK